MNENKETELTMKLDCDTGVELCVLLNTVTNKVRYVVYDPDDCNPITGRNFREYFASYADALEVYEEHVARYAD